MKAGLVTGEKAGKFIEYSLTEKGKKIVANLVKLF